MRRDEMMRLLGGYRAELRRLAVKDLAFFGSVARDEAREDSDVDVLVEFAEPVTFARFMDLTFFLEERLGCRVDLVTPRALKSRLRRIVEKDLVHVPGL